MVPRDSGMRTDIKETENGYELSVDMPGYDKKDISVELSHGYLTISAKREEKEENKKYLRRERSYSCSRSYYVGENIKREHVKAKYEGGTLHLAFPKEEKKEIPDKRIEIE
ncbi:MAG: Hsp20/alpha crystallin family protein [Clostridia bacterium]|nr:Hsp20/alpha crystallin family protein [Clostridia bacterium]